MLLVQGLCFENQFLREIIADNSASQLWRLAPSGSSRRTWGLELAEGWEGRKGEIVVQEGTEGGRESG